MSANNWAVCPQCIERRNALITEASAEVAAAYGKVSVAEFDRMRATVAEREAETVEATFREDYEIGLDDDAFFVVYKGSCKVCGLTKAFNHLETLVIAEGGGAS